MTERDRCDYVFRVQNVCDDIPGVGHLLSSFIPTPGIFATRNKKSANARGLARGGGGGWAQLELTDALVELSAYENYSHKRKPKKNRVDVHLRQS